MQHVFGVRSVGAQGAENGCRDCVTEFRFQLFWEKSSSRRGHVWFLFVFPYFFAMGDLVTGSSVLVSRSFSRARIEGLRKGSM